MKEIKIDAPGAGDLVMGLCHGWFNADRDHSFAVFDDGKFLGGFVCCEYLGNSIAIHDGAVAKNWCSRELLWALFDYVFRQLKCQKVYAPVPSDNYHALEMDLRGGWKLDTVLIDALAPGRHLMILSMVATECRWLRHRPRRSASPTVVEGLHSGREG